MKSFFARIFAPKTTDVPAAGHGRQDMYERVSSVSTDEELRATLEKLQDLIQEALERPEVASFAGPSKMFKDEVAEYAVLYTLGLAELHRREQYIVSHSPSGQHERAARRNDLPAYPPLDLGFGFSPGGGFDARFGS